MFNKVILMGRICNDLELKDTAGGNKVLSFRLAVTRNYQPKDGEKVTDFLNIVAWRGTAEFIAKYFTKGNLILIDGEIQTRSYEDNNGATQWVTEIVVSNAKFTGESKKEEGRTPGMPPIVTAVPPPEEVKRFAETGTSTLSEPYPF